MRQKIQVLLPTETHILNIGKDLALSFCPNNCGVGDSDRFIIILIFAIFVIIFWKFPLFDKMRFLSFLLVVSVCVFLYGIFFFIIFFSAQKNRFVQNSFILFRYQKNYYFSHSIWLDTDDKLLAK